MTKKTFKDKTYFSALKISVPCRSDSGYRALFRTGATGASAPAEIKLQVRLTRPEDEYKLKVPSF